MAPIEISIKIIKREYYRRTYIFMTHSVMINIFMLIISSLHSAQTAFKRAMREHMSQHEDHTNFLLQKQLRFYICYSVTSNVLT